MWLSGIGFFYSVLFSGDSSKLLHVSIVGSFFLLSSIPFVYKQLVYHSPTEEHLIVSNCIYHGQSDNNLDGGGEKWI